MKADMDELHAIFAEEEHMTRYHKDDIGIPTHNSI